MYSRRPLCTPVCKVVVSHRAFADASNVALVLPVDMPRGYFDMPRGYFAGPRSRGAFACNHEVTQPCDAAASRTPGEPPAQETASIWGL